MEELTTLIIHQIDKIEKRKKMLMIIIGIAENAVYRGRFFSFLLYKIDNINKTIIKQM